MTVRKINGFRAPYRSLTFREEANLLVKRNGVLYMSGVVSQVGLNITIPPFAFIQQGLTVEVDTSTTITAPTMDAPYYLTVTSLSVSNIDDLRWTFAKSPLDLSETEVIVASYDGLEWRAPQYLTFDGVYTDIDNSNIDFELVGPFSGLLTTLDGSNYRNAGGKLVDRQGLRTRLDQDALFSVVADDPDYSRVDKVIYRRPNDSVNRIGVREFLTGGTFDTSPSVIKNTEYLDSSAVRKNVKVLVSSSNIAHTFTAVGYGTSYSLSYSQIASDRSSIVVDDVELLSDMTDPVFDVAIDSTGDFHVVYTSGLQVKWKKFNAAAALVAGPTRIDTQSTQCRNPVVAIDPSDTAVFIAYQCLTGVSVSQIYFRTLTLSGSAAVAPRSMAGAVTKLVEPSIFVTDDLWVYLSWTDETAAQVYYRVFDDIGDPLTSLTLVSGNTAKSGGGTLSGGAKKSKIVVSDNKKVFVGFLQDRGGSLYNLSLWADGAATTQTLVLSGENFTSFDMDVEPIFNGINLSLAQASRADYVRLDEGAILFALQLSTSGVTHSSLAKDRLGSLIHTWSTAQSGTYTSYDAGIGVTHTGATTITGAMGVTVVGPNQFVSLVSSFTGTPKAGDRVVITGSTLGNNGTYFLSAVEFASVGAPNDRYLFTVTSNFASAETNITGGFSYPDGNSARFAKSVSDTKMTAYRYTTLDSDVLLARISTPGPVILNYVTHTGPSEIRKPYLVGGADVVIDWGKTTLGYLTISGGLKLLNLLDNVVYSVVDGSFEMTEGDALYVVLDGIDTAPVPQVVPREMLPWGNPIQVLGVIEEGLFSPLLLSEEMTQLDSGESDKIGEDLPVSLRERLGITSETTYQPYTSTYVVATDDTYPEAISKLDDRVEAIETNHPDEQEFTGDGVTKIFTLTQFLLNSSNSVMDNEVYVAGRKQRQDPTGGLNRSYRKISTTQIEFVEAPRLNDEITVRKEGTNYGGPIPPLSGKLWSDPVDSDIKGPDLAYDLGSAANRFGEAHVQKTVTERVELAVPVGTVTLIKSMINGGPATILAGQPVSKYSDGKIYPADSDSAEGQSFIGVAAENIASGASGRILLPGHNIPGALTGLGFSPGDDIYLSETGGGYTNSPGSYAGADDSIIRVGIADCGEGAASPTATDLVMMTYVIARP